MALDESLTHLAEIDGAVVMRTECEVNKEDEGRRVITIETLSNAQLIKLIQFEAGDDNLMDMVEAELERRKTGGTRQ
jgi:hypothetical protein